MSEKKQIKLTQVGQNIILKVPGDKKQLVFTSAEKPKREEVKTLVAQYNKLPSESRLNKILKLIAPKKQKAELAVVAKKKVEKHTKKSTKRDLKEVKALGKQVSKEVREALGNDPLFHIADGEVFLKPWTTVPMPILLVAKFVEEKNKGNNTEPLQNFWMRCLANTNPIARNKLFDYISRHKLVITEHGYIVTYRMVKKTDKPDVFTHAHSASPRLYYRMGEPFRIPRSECDEDGGHDCSRGLHTGTPNFIGIEGLDQLGEGYVDKSKVSILRKSEGGGYGTGYDYTPQRIQELRQQTFSESFGNQAVIVLVDPMHVVSVPLSDTRKLRACELFFVKTTTPEEVVDIQTSEFSVYSHSYNTIEKEELAAKLKEMKLEVGDYAPDTNFDVKIDEIKKRLKIKEDALKAKLSSVIGDDPVNKELSLEEINSIIAARLAVNSK